MTYEGDRMMEDVAGGRPLGQMAFRDSSAIGAFGLGPTTQISPHESQPSTSSSQDSYRHLPPNTHDSQLSVTHSSDTPPYLQHQSSTARQASVFSPPTILQGPSTITYVQTQGSMKDMIQHSLVCQKLAKQGQGNPSEEDLVDFIQHGVYSERALEGVSIRTDYAIITGSGGFPGTTETLIASKCQDFQHLLSAAKYGWRTALMAIGMPEPPEGFNEKNFRVETQESYDENMGTWNRMYNDQRYEEWFLKNVRHGRARVLHARITYVYY